MKIFPKKNNQENRGISFKSLKISQYVQRAAKKMVSLIKDNQFYTRIENLGKYHYDIIKDQASYFQEKLVLKRRFLLGSKGMIKKILGRHKSFRLRKLMPKSIKL
jgi:hypothetical protein